MHDQNGRYGRLRYAATGALAAFIVVGAIAGTVALAANHGTKPQGRAAAASDAAKTPAMLGKAQASQPDPSQLFLNDVQRLLNDGTINAAQAEVLGREIRAGRIDTNTLTSSGFTQTQLQAVQQTLANTKRALASAAHRSSASPARTDNCNAP